MRAVPQCRVDRKACAPAPPPGASIHERGEPTQTPLLAVGIVEGAEIADDAAAMRLCPATAVDAAVPPDAQAPEKIL